MPVAVTGRVTGRLALLATACFLLACSAKPAVPPGPESQGIEISGLRIQNRSFSPVTEVILLVSSTRAFISCGNIPMRGECATGFPLHSYQGDHIEIKWKQGGSEWSSGDFELELPAGIDPRRPAMVRVVITATGLAETELVQ